MEFIQQWAMTKKNKPQKRLISLRALSLVLSFRKLRHFLRTKFNLYYLDYFSRFRDGAIMEFQTYITEPLQALVSKNNLKTLELLPADEDSCAFAFKFAVHYFTVRLEADGRFRPVIVSRRKRDLSDSTDLGEEVCRLTSDELYEIAGTREPGVFPAQLLFLKLTGLDSIEYTLQRVGKTWEELNGWNLQKTSGTCHSWE